MVARGGRLQFRRCARRRLHLVEFFLGKKNTGQAGAGLITERVKFNRLPGQPLSLLKLTKINYYSRHQIVGGRVPRRELLCMPEFGQTLGKFPLDKKANPSKNAVRVPGMQL